MSRLEIRLLGPLDVTVDGARVSSFETESARALLAYLASEPGRTRSRPVVAEMFWPERPEGAALSNLRHVLSVLRRALGDLEASRPALVADRTTVSIEASDDVWVDLVEFERLAAIHPEEEGAVEAWERAVTLWRGPLLEGLGVRAGAEWEEWLVVTGERVRRDLAMVLRRLADHHERSGAWDEAIAAARRLTEVDPWEERAHRQVMRLLARSGERGRALSHFTDLEDRLHRELGTTPAPETAALADQIRAGDLARMDSEAEITYPLFLTKESTGSASLFVGRARELDLLGDHLDAASAGRGRVVFISGEAGSGKTSLAREFMRRATGVPGLLVASGHGNAFGGFGDPYLPFREVLGLLCGNVESGYMAGAIDREQATRLWEAIPHSARLVSELAPGLIGVMVNGGLLIDRVEQAVPGADWVGGLRSRVEAFERRPPAPDRLQPALFDDYTAVLERLSITRPVLVVIDDLQWADRGSIALLWHLGRRVEGMRVLIVGVYRPEELGSGLEDSPSLLDVVRDLQARTPDCMIELLNDRAFIDDLLDAEPNALDREFRERLFAYTGGHPLFTVEMVRGMQERAEIRKDRHGVWGIRGSLDWDRLPSRVEAVIAQRIARVPDELRRDMTVASVQGEEFIAEIVGTIRSDPAAPARLSRESSDPHRLIDASGVDRLGDAIIGRHRFRHVLFQRYLYDRLDQTERIRLHEATGRALEDLYGGRPDLPVVDLARHFDEAGLVEPAIGYLHEAARRAIRMAASEEAIRLVRRALELLPSLPESAERNRLELDLLTTLAAPVMAVRGYAAPDAERIGERVLALCEHVPASSTTVIALTGLARVLSLRARYRDAAAVSGRALMVASSVDAPDLTIPALQLLGYAETWMAELDDGHHALERAHRRYDPDDHAWLTHAIGSAIGPEALVWDAVNTLHRGFPDRAVELADRGIEMARDVGHAFTLCHTLAVGGSVVRAMSGDYGAALPFIDEFEAIASAEHFPFYAVAADVHRGQVIGHGGDPDAGIDAITRGLDAWREMGIEAFRSPFLGDIGEFHLHLGRSDRAMAVIEGALEDIAALGERLSEITLLVQLGVALRACGDATGARVRLDDAAAAARAAGARLLELRAATALAELHLAEGDPRGASEVLAPVYSSFGEGLHTPHLAAARAVLEAV